MRIHDRRFTREIEEAVRTIERTTAAEVVVVVAPRSGSYRDLAVISGAAVAWIALVALLVAPQVFHPFWVAVELPLVTAGAAWVSHRASRLLRLLSSETRMRRQVEAAAHLAFHEEAVHGTRGRTGVLVYLSILEDRVVVVPDAGIEAVVPGAAWNGIRWGGGEDPARPRDLPHFIQGLRDVGRVLTERFPAPERNENEIPDAPRIRG